MERKSENTAVKAETSVGDLFAKNAHMVERSWSDNPLLDERKLRSMAVHMVESSGCSLTPKGTSH